MQPRTAIASLLALTLVAGLFPATSMAFHNPGVPEIAAVQFTGNHWAAWRIQTTETGRIDVEAEGSYAGASAGSFGTWLLNKDGSLRGAAVTTGFPGNVGWTHVEVLGNVIADSKQGAGGGAGIAAGFTNVPPGEYIALAMAGSDGTISGELSVYAPASTSVIGASEGDDAFFLREPDFSGTLNIFHQQSGAGPAKVIVDVNADEDVSGRLYGLYQMISNTKACMIEYGGPNGGGAGSSIYFVHNGPQGVYDFSIPQCVDASPPGLFPAVIWAVGADVTLP